jgi:GntR family histidine utilization transcriptional repressor
MTVSRADGIAGQAGLVERRKKAGSFVARPRDADRRARDPRHPGADPARGEAYRFQRLSGAWRRPAPRDPDEAARRARPPVLAVRGGLHFAGGEPFALERRSSTSPRSPQAADLAFDCRAAGTWLLRHVPWTEGAPPDRGDQRRRRHRRQARHAPQISPASPSSAGPGAPA